MRVPQKRCICCGRWYRPDPRTAAYQKACSRPHCRRARQARAWRHWRIRHPNVDAYRRNKIRAWAKAFPDYWRQWRADHPAYVARDNLRRRRRHKERLRAAKPNAISQMAVGRLRDIQAIEPDFAAKPNAIARRVQGLLDFLLWKEAAAKRDATALPAASG